MKLYKLDKSTDLIFGSKGAIAAAAFFFMIGISAGAFLEIAMDASSKAEALRFISAYLSGGDFDAACITVFGSGVTNNLFLLAIMMISGLVTIGFPAAYAVTLYKGMTIGFSACLIIENYSLSSIAPLTISILPQNLLLVPTFILAAAVSQNYSLRSVNSPGKRHKKSSRSPNIGLDRYIAAYLLLSLCAVLGCIVETVIYFLKQV